MRRTRKNSTGNSTDSESSDESLENLTIRDEVAEVNTKTMKKIQLMMNEFVNWLKNMKNE